MEGAAPRTRRRRRMEAPERQEPPHEQPPPATAADSFHPEAANQGEEPRRQEPPPAAAAGGEEGDGVDRISALPDVVLGEIISLLPTKDGVRTQALARRWRHLWRSAPLNLDHVDLPADEIVQIDIIGRILAAHPGPARRLCIPLLQPVDHHETFDAWLRSPALDNLQELQLEYPYISLTPRMQVSLPASAFRSCATLRVTTITERQILDETVEALHFPQLRHLGLEAVFISEDALHSMISGCPVLECFLLKFSEGFSCIRINSPSLISIGLSGRSAEIIIENAPSLQRLLQLFGIAPHVSVISAPKLETLRIVSGYCNNSRLQFGSTVIQGLHAVSVATVSCGIKTLGISMHSLSLDMVIDFMRCFPSLENLYIHILTSNEPVGNNLWGRKHRDLIRCLDIHLKTVVLKHYRGIKSQVNFATFFIMKAKRLEAMTFVGGVTGVYCEQFIAKQRRLLQLKKRASRGARFHFITRCHHVVPLIMHVQDLSVANPFECECFNRARCVS